MDTRTSPGSPGGRSQGIEEPITSAVKVPSDPAQVIVNHASFRVKLGRAERLTRQAAVTTEQGVITPTSVRSSSGAYAPAQTETGAGVAGTGVAGTGAEASGKARVTPVVWTGRAEPGDTAATQLLETFRAGVARRPVPGVGESEEEGHSRAADRGASAYRSSEYGHFEHGCSGHGFSGEHPHQDRGIQDGPFADRGFANDWFVDGPSEVLERDRGDEPGDTGRERGGEPVTGRRLTPRPYVISPRSPLAVDPGGPSSAAEGPVDWPREAPKEFHHDGASPDGDPYGDRPHGDDREYDDRPGDPQSEADEDRYGTPFGPGEAAAGGGGRHAERGATRTGAPVRHAHHPPSRRGSGAMMLLLLRIFLGGISVYAGMSKLCDPDFFDGSDRGAMARWLSSLHPWAVAEPLRDFALGHPVGSGLTVAFLQIVVGALTVLGLWQRAAAGTGILLSAALLVTVGWRSFPAYHASDVIHLVAWSPLLIAGASSYSLDRRLANEAWRTLGPHCPANEMRRRVLRRGAATVAVVVGLALLVGSMLGGAVRAGGYRTTVPDPAASPTGDLPGGPLPSTTDRPENGDRSQQPGSQESQSPSGLSPTPRQTLQSSPERARQGGGPARGAGDQPSRSDDSTATRQPATPDGPRPSGDPSGDDGALGGILGAGGLGAGPDGSGPAAEAQA